MIETSDFYKSLLDSLREQIVVIDSRGLIRFVNAAWVTFGQQNRCKIDQIEWTNVNYLEVCTSSGRRGEKFGLEAARGISKVIKGELEHFDIEDIHVTARARSGGLLCRSPPCRRPEQTTSRSHIKISRRAKSPKIW